MESAPVKNKREEIARSEEEGKREYRETKDHLGSPWKGRGILTGTCGPTGYVQI